ncbi:MAG: DMT family transporter [Gemmatimonadota bacterium]
MSRANVLRFLLLATIWGASFLFIEVSLRGLNPMQVVVGRVVTGAAVLLVLVAVGRQSLPRGWAIWGHLTLLAMTANIIPFFLFAWAQERVTSGLAGVLNGSTPLFTLAIAVAALPEERASAGRLGGLLLGFLGVVIVVGPWDQNPLTSSVPGQLACLGASLCYGISFVYTRRVLTGRGFRPLALSAGQLGAAGAIMLVIAPWIARGPVTLSAPVLGSIVTLGALGTGLAYPLYYRLIVEAGATTASLVTYLTPIMAVLLGAVVLGEPVTWNLFAGAAVVILGVATAEGRLGRLVRAPMRPTVDAPMHQLPPDSGRDGSGPQERG